MLCIVSALGLSAQTWTAPTIQGEDPVDGQQYKVMNVATCTFLDMGKAWFGWSTTAILSNAGIDFTMTADGDNWKFIRTGTQGVFTSGNGIAGDAMHVDNTAHTYGITKLPNGYYHIHDAGGDANSLCWGNDGTTVGVVAHADATANGWMCEWVFLQDLSGVPVYSARLNFYNIYLEASAAGVNTDAAAQVYNNAEATVDQLNAAANELKKDIVKAQVASQFVGADAANPVDATSLITNPAPYATANGWNVSKTPTFDNGNKNAEFWNAGGAYIKQTLSYLPAGSYILEAIALTRTGMHGTLSAGEASMEIATVGSGTVNTRGAANTWFNNGNGVNKLFFNLAAETENFEIGLTADNTTGDHWTVWRSFKLTYYGDATEEEIALVEATAELKKAVEAANAQVTSLTGKVPAATLSTLETAITDNNKDFATVAEYEAAMKAISDAVATANVMVWPYTYYKKAAAAANALDDDAELYTGDATIDIADADAAAEAATDKAGIDAAVVMIQDVVNEFLDAVTLKDGNRFDITDIYLENADFEAPTASGVLPPGWTINISGGNLGQQNATYTNADAGVTISKFIESWAGLYPAILGAGEMKQTASVLPEGTYVLECDANASHDGNGSQKIDDVDVKLVNDLYGASLFVKSPIKEVLGQNMSNPHGKPLHYSVEFVHGGQGNVEFGLRIAADNNVQWLGADNFKVYYAGPMPLEEYEKLLGETLTAAQDYDKEVPEAALDALMDAADEQDKSWTSKDEYRAAIAAINAAVEATDALVAPYADYKALVKECEPLQAVDNDNEAANATFQAAIESEAIEDCKTLEDIAAVKAALAQARLTYIAEANPAKGEKFDLSFMLTNPNLEGLPTWAKAEGWYTEQTDGNSQVMVNDNATSEDGTKKAFFEYWKNPAAANNLFALYQKVTLPAGTYNMSCYAFAQDDQTHINHPNGVYFYANDVQGSAVNNARLSQAQIEFVNATEQEVKIGLKTVTGNVNFWMGIGYVELYKIAPKTIEIAENVDFEPVAAAGDVTLTRTIKADTWNTFVVPFQITNDELKATFGDDVEVAEESEVAHGDLSTISFTKMETPAITPNKPVLLKTSTAGTVYNFEGRTIATSEPVVIGTNFDFVGTYASGKIAAGDYFIGSDKLFLSDGSVNVAGTHAYLKAKAAGVKAELFIDGVATAIESIDAETAQPAGAIYNVAGQRVQKAQRGLYIMGGKKVVVK